MSQQLKPGIVSRTKLLLKKYHENLKNTQIPAHLFWHPANQISLCSNLLSRRICFRIPRKTKELENLPYLRVSSHPKAGYENRKVGFKWYESFATKLRLSRSLSSHYYPDRCRVGWRVVFRRFALPSNRADQSSIRLNMYSTITLQKAIFAVLSGCTPFWERGLNCFMMPEYHGCILFLHHQFGR